MFVDVSWKPIGHIVDGQAVQEGGDNRIAKCRHKFLHILCNIPDEQWPHLAE